MREYRIQEAPSSRKNRVGAHVWVDSAGRMVSYNGGVIPYDMLGLRYIDCDCGDITAGAYLLRPVDNLGTQQMRYAVCSYCTKGASLTMYHCATKEAAFEYARTFVGENAHKAQVVQILGTVESVASIQETRY